MAVIAEMIPLDGGPHYPIGQTLTVVGRSEQCDIHIAHSSVSSRHCVCTGSEGFIAVDSGLTFLLTDIVQLDIYIGRGLVGQTEDMFVGIGISFRLPR